MLIGGIAYGFQRSAVDLRPSMRSFQSEEHSGGLCVLQGASLTVDIRQHDQSVAARRHSSRLPRHDCIGVFAALLFGFQLFAVQQVTHPAGQCARRIGAVAQTIGARHGKGLPTLEGAVALRRNIAAHEVVRTIVIEHRGAILKKGRARLHQTHADGLCRGVTGTGNDRRSRGKAGLCRSLRCDRAHDVCGPCTRRDLVRAAVQPALCLVHTAVRLVQRSERAFGKGLIDDIFPGQARRQKGAAREEIGRLCVDLRLMPPQPEDLCGRVAGADGMAEQLLHPRLSVMLCQPRRFL